MNWFELIGVVFGLLCVWLTAKQSIWSWPIGIVNVAAFSVLFYQNKLYPDMCLHVVYLWLSVYGWVKWSMGKFNWSDKAPQLEVQRITKSELLVWLTIIPFTSMLMGHLFATYTQSANPYVDSTITVISLIAQYLMARKILESWLFWMVVDVIAMCLYDVRGLYLTSILYFVYLILCIKGWAEWKYDKRV